VQNATAFFKDPANMLSRQNIFEIADNFEAGPKQG